MQNIILLVEKKETCSECHKSNKHAIFDMDVSINVQFIIDAFKISSAFESFPCSESFARLLAVGLKRISIPAMYELMMCW